MPRKKVLVVGLDGVTFDLIKPWVEKGELPTFEKLMKNGVYGNLKSTIPPFTGSIWVSFLTGKKPEKHGIFYFFKLRDRKVDLVNLNDIRSDTILNILDNAGRRSIIINLPLTYPPRPLNGFMVTGMFTPSESHEYTYPPSLKEEINKIASNYMIEPAFSFKELKQEKISILFQALENRYRVMRYLMKKRWDFFFILFREPDILQHQLWDDRPTLLRLYKKIDAMLEKIPKLRNTNILIISDHGFQRLEGTFYVNKLLMNHGFLYVHTRKNSILERIGLMEENVQNFIVKHNLFFLKNFMKKYFPALTNRLSKKESWTMEEEVDWDRTQAFFDGGGIYINRDVVSKERYNEVKQSIIDLLMESGIRVKIHILDQSDGEGATPDIIIEPDEWKIEASVSLKTKNVFEKASGGTHAIDGIFIAYGPDIKKSGKIKETHIIDIIPTILHILNLPITEDMDGRILREIFKPQLAKRPVKVIASLEKEGKEEIYTKEEEKKIKERLRTLGYLK